MTKDAQMPKWFVSTVTWLIQPIPYIMILFAGPFLCLFFHKMFPWRDYFSFLISPTAQLRRHA